jgi:hypothetical protein
MPWKPSSTLNDSDRRTFGPPLGRLGAGVVAKAEHLIGKVEPGAWILKDLPQTPVTFGSALPIFLANRS